MLQHTHRNNKIHCLCLSVSADASEQGKQRVQGVIHVTVVELSMDLNIVVLWTVFLKGCGVGTDNSVFSSAGSTSGESLRGFCPV